MEGPVDARTREALRRSLLDEGFVSVGFTDARPVTDHLSAWVAGGHHAGMDYMARTPAARADPSRLLPGLASVVCVAAAYPAAERPSPGAPPAPIAAYARGDDYHHTMRDALQRAVDRWPELLGHTPATRLAVDTLPLLERAFAARAGLGWIGRNTLLLDERHGPWLLLGEVLTDLEIPPDAPGVDRCGTCRACLDACPTEALDAQRGLDARRCLSYWTIEHRGELPDTWAAAAAGRVFGCDDCLTACPFPGRSAPLADPGPYRPQPELGTLGLDEIERRAKESFRRHFARTPVERARKHGLLRNLVAARRHGPSGGGSV